MSMIIHKLIARHLRAGADPHFYLLQANDAIRWMEKRGVVLSEKTEALDLGCEHGIFGTELSKRGCRLTFADQQNMLRPELAQAPFRQINLDRDDIAILGQYDLVVCSNVLEHLSQPVRFLENMANLLRPGGFFYLSWTNWLSPWGGHSFSPFHYLGPRKGHLVYDRLRPGKRRDTPFVNLYPTYIGPFLKLLRAQPSLRIVRMAPRYYPEFAFLVHLPIAREFLCWNCATLLQKKP